MYSQLKKDISNNQSLSSSIFNILRERILKGEYAAGEKIIENQIANELKVSRTPIREAFKQLEQAGLIETISNRGAFVLGFTKQDIDDIYEIRKAIESIAIVWAMERISEEELDKLKETYELMEFYCNKGDVEKILEMNNQFHDIIYKATDSRFLSHILKTYQFYVEKTRKAAVVESRIKETTREHKNILNAFMNRNTEQGMNEIIRHLENGKVRASHGMKIVEK
ncbi:MAG: GntR family transcriptional regulator [Peptostreptococcales bacterium]